MSHKLRVGELQALYLTEEQIWRTFTTILTTRSKKSATYKYGLLKAMIENLYQVDEKEVVTYEQLAYSFAKIYWNLVIHHHGLEQGTSGSAVVNRLIEIQREEGIPKDITFDKLDATIQVKATTRIKTVMKTNVFGALYGDTQGSFYAFDHKEERFQFNRAVLSFMRKYQLLMVDLVNYHMAKMIEKLNDVPHINYLLEKVESIAKRSTLKPFERVLLQYFEKSCFYCGKHLNKGQAKTHVDHFIPWSFVQSDQLWNLVLTCSHCNTSKNDKLPVRDYLSLVVERNEVLVGHQEIVTQNQHLMNYKEEKMIHLYDYFIQNGYENIWLP
ncbi:HNH endonuclease [Halobacillus karajensis]|uniref:HNH endonuclease domain-containing protein n=1 Tax=Halobacillus karajensis TaxID=195088 RepID=UPI0008A761AF|nr:HNH endonuclease domain-containing protein [Halobacillus karajensis]SEH83569.1 HNH endonuclease [Halobacillus karajensis]